MWSSILDFAGTVASSALSAGKEIAKGAGKALSSGIENVIDHGPEIGTAAVMGAVLVKASQARQRDEDSIPDDDDLDKIIDYLERRRMRRRRRKY